MKYLLFLFTFAIYSQVYAYDFVSYDYEIMKDEFENTYIDFTWGTNSDILRKQGLVAIDNSIKLHFSLTALNEKTPIDSLTWMLNTHLDTNNQLIIIDYLGRQIKSLTRPNYHFKFKVYNQNHKLLQSKEFNIDLVKLDKNISSLKLAYLIENKNKLSSEELSRYSEFINNDKVIIPNPYSEFYETNDKMYIYWQKWSKKEINKYRINLLDGARREIAQYEVNLVNQVENYFEIPIDTIATGSYSIKVTAIDNSGSDIFSSLKKVYIMNKEIAPNLETKFLESITFEQSEFSSMTNEQLDYEFERLKYILSKFEINQFIQLSSEKAKQRAIFQYWKVRDPDTNTRVNERLEEYNRATTYANTYFSFSSSDDGWKTDRGRILMKYGFPSEKKTFLPRNRQKTTEEWLYPSIQGGAYFYFVDVKENSNLQLVHSSAINEVRNDTWIYDYNAAYDENDPKFINQLKSEEVRRKSR